MISRIAGKLIEKREQSVILEVNGLFYEVVVPLPVLERLEETADAQGHVHLITYHYIQIGPARDDPMLIGFITEIERDFFLQFIKVSGIGPRAAVKALDKPIGEVTRAIEEGDLKYLQTLSGIGAQRAKEIVAKLQGKIGKFGLVRDKKNLLRPSVKSDWQEEALNILLQLQYKRQEAQEMIEKALQRSGEVKNAEELLNEIYKQRVKAN